MLFLLVDDRVAISDGSHEGLCPWLVFEVFAQTVIHNHDWALEARCHALNHIRIDFSLRKACSASLVDDVLHLGGVLSPLCAKGLRFSNQVVDTVLAQVRVQIGATIRCLLALAQ